MKQRNGASGNAWTRADGRFRVSSYRRRLRVSAIGGWCIVGIIALGLAVAPGIQRLPAQEMTDFTVEWVDSTAFPINTVYYTTTDTTGEPGAAMWAPDHVTVFENDRETYVGGFEDGDHAPAYLSLIIDSSGSMENSLDEVLAAARSLVDQLSGGDRAEIIDFDTAVVTRRSFTDNRDEMHSALDGISVGGGTALYDAIAVGFDHLAAKTGMKTVLVLSDGEDENSTGHTFDSLAERLRGEGVRVFTIALGHGVDTETMSQIAELSGGEFYHAISAADVDGIYTRVITYLHSLHRFWYSTPIGAFDGSARDVVITHQPTGIRRSVRYTAPEHEFWSHTILYPRDHPAAPVKIAPGGEYIAQPQYGMILDAAGRRHTLRRWQERYDGTMTENFVCGWVHRDYGFLDRYDAATGTYETLDDGTIVAEDAAGDFHREFVWRPKAISPNERYLVMCAATGEKMEHNYRFIVYDRIDARVLWEHGFYIHDFDEPGPAAVANDGTAAVVQEGNLFVVEPDGERRVTLMWRETGHYWGRMAMDAAADLILGRSMDGSVWLYTGDGDLRWQKESPCHEQGGFLAVSPNGQYLAYADHSGPHIVDPTGTVLFELPADETGNPPNWPFPNGVDVANTGAFVYSIGNRIHYRRGIEPR